MCHQMLRGPAISTIKLNCVRVAPLSGLLSMLPHSNKRTKSWIDGQTWALELLNDDDRHMFEYALQAWPIKTKI